MKLNSKKSILIGVIIVLVVAISAVGMRLLSAPVTTPPPVQSPETKLKQITYQLRIPEEAQITPSPAAASSLPTPTAVISPTRAPSPTLLAQAATPTPVAATPTPVATQIATASPTLSSTQSAQTTTPEAGTFHFTIAFFMLAIALIAFSFAL